MNRRLLLEEFSTERNWPAPRYFWASQDRSQGGRSLPGARWTGRTAGSGRVWSVRGSSWASCSCSDVRWSSKLGSFRSRTCARLTWTAQSTRASPAANERTTAGYQSINQPTNQPTNQSVVVGMADQYRRWPGWWDRLVYDLFELGARHEDAKFIRLYGI